MSLKLLPGTRMRPQEAWKNFNLGDELSIAGTFIYNGLRRFHEMRSLDHTDEIFEFFYNLSVGLERLLKIVVVLLEHNEKTDQEALEKSLITHNHVDLLNRIKTHPKLNFGDPHITILSLLSKFYISHRYDRFSLNSIFAMDKERESLYAFLNKFLKVEIEQDSMGLFATKNEDRYRQFIRRTVLKISNSLYEIIKDRAHDLNIYTYEVRYGSRAFTVFLGEADVPAEEILWKELLIFFMNSNADTGLFNFLKDIEPLDFDPAEAQEYLQCFESDSAKSYVVDTLEHLYGELDKDERKERLEKMSVLGDPSVYFPEDDEEDTDY